MRIISLKKKKKKKKYLRHDSFAQDLTIQFVRYQNAPITTFSNTGIPVAYNDAFQTPETRFDRHNKLSLHIIKLPPERAESKYHSGYNFIETIVN